MRSGAGVTDADTNGSASESPSDVHGASGGRGISDGDLEIFQSVLAMMKEKLAETVQRAQTMQEGVRQVERALKILRW